MTLVKFKLKTNIMKQTFWQRNQVLITGIAGAIVLVLQQFIEKSTETINYPSLALAVLVAVGGYLGNALRGKGITIGSFIGVVGTAFASIQATGHFTWSLFAITVTMGFLGIVASPAKPATYEQNINIVAAKEIPPVEQVVDDSKLPNPTNPGKPI